MPDSLETRIRTALSDAGFRVADPGKANDLEVETEFAGLGDRDGRLVPLVNVLLLGKSRGWTDYVPHVIRLVNLLHTVDDCFLESMEADYDNGRERRAIFTVSCYGA